MRAVEPTRNLFGPAKQKTIFGHGNLGLLTAKLKMPRGQQLGESQSVTALRGSPQSGLNPAGLEAPHDSERVEVHRRHPAAGAAGGGATSKLGAVVGAHVVHGEAVSTRGRGGARAAGRRPTDTHVMGRPRSAGPTPPTPIHATRPPPTLFIGGETANLSVTSTTPRMVAGAEVCSTSVTDAAGWKPTAEGGGSTRTEQKERGRVHRSS